jgi:hydroxylamine reductase (hybrid-cluster protein)
MEAFPMFCNQCQEAARGTGCDRMGVCGKTPETAAELDGLIARLIRLARGAAASEVIDAATARLVADGLFVTVTNVNFDPWARPRWRPAAAACPPATTRTCSPCANWCSTA